jgi:DNA-binding response OmpR family regulator
MTRMLVVQDDHLFCKKISEYLKSHARDEVEYALTGNLGTKLLLRQKFDIVLISATLPDTTGIELAKVAYNEHVPVLMLSENSDISAELRRLQIRYLQKPFSLDTLLSESRRVVCESRKSRARVRSCVATVEASLESLRLEIAEANQLFDAIVARLGYWKP